MIYLDANNRKTEVAHTVVHQWRKLIEKKHHCHETGKIGCNNLEIEATCRVFGMHFFQCDTQGEVERDAGTDTDNMSPVGTK